MKKLYFLSFVFFLSMSQSFGQALPNGKVYKVALLVPNGAELLDFAGPGEAFTQAPGFEVYLVSLTEAPIQSQGFMKITPNYSFRNCPKPDIILIPGGGTGNLLNEPDAVAWVRQHYDEGGTVLTVCTGASIAAKAGLLEGKKATTFHNAFDYVQNLCNDCELLREVRYVDNGRIITTAGISAGIDGTLHTIARIKGRDIAEAAAFNMEYDKWVPDEGLINYENAFIQYLEEQGPIKAKQQFSKELTSAPHSLFFVGEMKNLATELSQAGQHSRALEVLDLCLEYYPGEFIVFDQKRALLKTLGKPLPPDHNQFVDALDSGGARALMQFYEEAAAQFPGWCFFQEGHMNWIGYNKMNEGKLKDAKAIFELNAKAYPHSFNVYDSLAEAYMKMEQWSQARKYYQKSIELNPDNTNAVKMLEQMKDNR
jgi:putative intracellular protease/amidase